MRDFADAVDRTYLGLLARVVDGCRRAAWTVLTVAALISGIAAYFIAAHFMVNTNTSDLIARDLPFQRLHVQFNRAFPQLHENIVVVIDGQTGGLARKAARKLAHRFRQQPKLFSDVYQPGGGRFFIKNGLLYLNVKQLHRLGRRLSQAQPLIATLAHNSTLPELFTLLGQALDHTAADQPGLPGLATMISQLTKTIDAQTQGRFYQFPWQTLVSGESAVGKTQQQFLILTPKANAHAIRPYQESINTVRRVIQDLHLTRAAGVRARLTGAAVLDNDQLHDVSNGTSFATILSLVLVIALLILALRDWRLVVAALATLVNGLVWTTAFGLAVVGPFNLISISFAVLFVGLGIDFGIQFCMRYREEFYHTGNLPDALRSTGAAMGGALTLAAIAAAISFYSFVPTSYAGIIDLGIIAGSSMFFALIANLTLLPALLSVLEARPKVKSLRRHIGFTHIPVKRLAWGISAFALAAGLAAIPFVLRTHFNFDPLHLQNPNSEGVKTFRSLLAENKRSPYTIEALEPNLSAAKRLAVRVSRLHTVSQAVTLASFIPQHQRKKLAILQQMAVIVPPFTLATGHAAAPVGAPKLHAALANLRGHLARWQSHHTAAKLGGPVTALKHALERFLSHFKHKPAAFKTLQTRVMGMLPAELKRLAQSLQAKRVRLADLPHALKQRYRTPDGRARVQVFSSLNLNKVTALRRFVTAVSHVAKHATGTPVMLKQGGDAVIGAFKQATITAVALIVVLLMLIVRHLSDTLLALAPLVLASLLTIATMELLGMSFNLANIIVLPLLVGLGVAYGIYFVLRWRSGESMGQVLGSSTPAAILFSALTSMSSFASLAIAADPAVSMLGRTLSIALAWVLICTLIVLPAVLTLVSYAHGKIEVARNP